MARLRFPGRPGYRFDRIGVRYSADEARITTDPTLSIITSIHKGLQQFRDIFGDSDEDDTEFCGFTPAEVRAAEKNFQRAIKQEKQFLEQQAHQQKFRSERSKATLTCLAAAGLELTKNTRAPINLRKTYKKIVETGLVQDATRKIKPNSWHETSRNKSLQEVSRPSPHLQQASKVSVAAGKQNGQPVPDNVSNLKHIRLKRLTHNVDTQPVFRRPVGRPRKYTTTAEGAIDVQRGNSFESIAATSSGFGAKPLSKYTSMAKQILARATKQAVHTSSKLFTSTHKVRKFVLPTKSSRSSRVIKPNKRFLEDDNVHQLVAKQAKISPSSLTAAAPAFKAPIFGMVVGSEKSNSFSAFPSCGLTMSPFNVTRDKGFPAFSTAPQPSGTSSFMDGLANQKLLGSLDQPLIVEGKRPRKPSLIMRMKLVEDDPADEIRLQQQLSDATTAVKSDGQKPPADAKFSPTPLPSQTKGFGAPKSLIAPAKLFTDPSTCSLSSKAFRAHYKQQQILSNLPSQSTVVLRQAKLQLNRTALNRSKAALARSLKAQLKREAKLERRRRTPQSRFGRLSVSDPSAVSPGSSLSQLSPFSKLASDSAIERQKSGLFEGIEAGAGSFSPGSFGSPPVTPSSLQTLKPKNEKVDNYQASLIKHDALLKTYAPGSRWHCLVCSSMCVIKKNRKLPQVPLCKRCKAAYFFQVTLKPGSLKRKCKYGGRCNIHFSEKSILHCPSCKFRKFDAVMRKCKELGVGSYKMLREQRRQTFTEELYTPASRQRHKSEEEEATLETLQNKQTQEEFDVAAPARQRQTSRSGDRMVEPGLRTPGRTSNHSSELISASNLDKPLSVDVDQDTDPFSLSPPQTLSSSKSTPDKGLRSPSKKLGLTASDGDKVSEADEDGDIVGRSRGSVRGPRIKHVCRRAAMVFPQQRATFPEEPQKRTLTLSALPNEEKRQLWAKNKQEQTQDSSTDESNDETKQNKIPALASPDRKLQSPKEEQADTKKERKIGSNFNKKLALTRDEKVDDLREGKMPKNRITEARMAGTDVASKVKKKSISIEKTLAARKKGYTRKIRCRECKGCKTPECGVCVFCRDKPKFGGPGRIKKCCIHSVCLAPKIPRKATQAFIEPKSPTKTYRRDDDDQNGDHHTRSHNSRAGFRDSSSRYQEKRANNHWRVEGNGNGAKDDSEDVIEGAEENMDTYQNGHTSSLTSSLQNGLDMDGSQCQSKTVANTNRDRVVRYAKGKYSTAVEATIQFALADVRNPFIGRMAEAYVGKMRHLKHREKISVPQKQLPLELKPVQNETAYSFDVPLKTHFIRADYEEAYDLETAWSHGFSLTLTGPSCVRALCFLCGSAGKHEMLYCIVCCQPYHIFCLDENERPEYVDNEEDGDDGIDDTHSHHGSSNTVSWCCRRCQFCHVCGHQNGLLKCHRCKDTYHPECLGPNYPTRPSRKNIWVCTKCVRCKSCGATTPGVGTNATWTYDFSLCYECGRLMDKGNFCPICHKCYSDDDWESKMVQCAVCESWVHAKCEELTDEMYQLVSFLPEEVQYICRVCSTESPPYWERVLKSELLNGLLSVLNGLMGSKCAQMLLDSGPPKDSKKPRQVRGKHSDWSRMHEDSFNNENILNRSMTSSTDSADSSFLDISSSSDVYESVSDTGQTQEKPSQPNTSVTGEPSVSSTTDNSSSSYTRHLYEKEIVEKCDCEMVRISSDSQTTEPNKEFHGRNLVFGDKLLVPLNNAVNGIREGNDILQNPKANLADVITADSQSATRELLAANIPTINGEGSPHNSKSKDSVADFFLGIVSKESNGRIIDSVKMTPTMNSVKMTPTMNGDMGYPGVSAMTPLSQCDSTSSTNSPCSGDVMAASFSSFKILSGGTVHVQSPPVPFRSADDDPSSIQVINAEPHGSFTSEFFGVTAAANSAIPPGSFCPNPSRESITKNLFLVECSGENCVNTFNTDSATKCALGVEKDSSVNLHVESNGEIVSVNGNLRSVKNALPGMGIESSDNGALICDDSDHAGEDNVQQPQSSAAAAQELKAQSTSAEHERASEKLAAIVPNPTCDHHVRFGHTVQESLSQTGEFPRDFNSIKLKIDSGSYTTVEEFSEDVVRIIQALLFENEQYTTRKKQANSIRSVFIKHMERFFPWFNVNTCKLWEHNRKLPAGMLKDAVLPPSADHTYAQWLERKDVPMTPQPSAFKRVGNPQKSITVDGSTSEMCSAEKIQHPFVSSEDSRACLLCQRLGDNEPDLAGRLLYCGQDDWVHINCALWSAEVFEQDDGSLQNVLDAVSRGKKLRCNLCQQPGATVGCCEANCRANYHFMCARADRCSFQDDKTVFCKLHGDCVSRKVIRDGHFDISSRVCVNFDKIRSKSSWGKAVNPATLNVIIGSCTVESLGVLQSSLSDTEECLFPVDFRCTRMYWSTQDARRRCVYTCRIVKVEPDLDSPSIQIQDLRVVHDENHADYIPLDQLHLEQLGIPNFMKTASRSCGLAGDPGDDVVCLGSDSVTVTVTTVSFSSRSVNAACITQVSKSTVVFSETQSTSLRSTRNPVLHSDNPEHCFIVDEDDPHGVTKSWPTRVPKQKPKAAEPQPIDLTGLSPSTLALLSIKDPSKYIVPSATLDTSRNPVNGTSSVKTLNVMDEELGLVKIADRLNSAAGRSKQIKSPTFPVVSCLQQYSQLLRQTQHSEPQPPSPVSFSPRPRSHSSSEERHSHSFSPLSSAPRSIFPASSSSVVSSAQPLRARSVSPFTVIKPQVLVHQELRSSSLPPDLAVHAGHNVQDKEISSLSFLSSAGSVLVPQDNSRKETGDVCTFKAVKSGCVTPIEEISEDEEKIITEDANRKSNLDPNLNSENLEVSNTDIRQPRPSSPVKENERGSEEERFCDPKMDIENAELSPEILSTEDLKSILESVPSDVLEGEDLKVVVLTDIEDLSEEEIMNLASAVLQESTVKDDKELCNGEVCESEGQKGEETAKNEKSDDADTRQGDAENDAEVHGDHDSPTSANSASVNNGDTLKGGEPAQSASEDALKGDAGQGGAENNVLTDQTPYGHSSVTSTSSFSSRGNSQDNGDDDDLRKPHKDAESKKKEDTVYVDLDNKKLKKDGTDVVSTSVLSLEAAIELEASFTTEDGRDSTKSHSDDLTGVNNTQVIIVDQRDKVIERNAESSLLPSGKEIESKTFDNETEAASCLSASEIKSSWESHRERGMSVGSAAHMLDGSPAEAYSMAYHSFTDISEDDVKIIDLSDSEKLSPVKVANITAQMNVLKTLCGRREEIVQQNSVDSEICVLNDEKNKTFVNNNSTDFVNISGNVNSKAGERLNSYVNVSVPNVEKPFLTKNSRGSVKFGSQNRVKAGMKAVVSTQDTTTDEESDYLMLDDLSCSETNEDDDCNEVEGPGRNDVEPSFDPSQSGVGCEDRQSRSLKTESDRNQAVNFQESVEMLENSTNCVLLMHKELKKTNSMSQKTGKWNTEGTTAQLTSCEKSVGTAESDSNDLMDLKCAGAKAPIGNAEHLSNKTQIKLKPCFVALRKEDAVVICTSKISASCGQREGKPESLLLRNRKSSSKVTTCLGTSDTLLMKGCHDAAESKVKDATDSKNSDARDCLSYGRHEQLNTCESNVDKHVEECSLLEMDHKVVVDEQDKISCSSFLQQSEVTGEEAKEIKTNRSEDELKEKHSVSLRDKSVIPKFDISREKMGDIFAVANCAASSDDPHFKTHVNIESLDDCCKEISISSALKYSEDDTAAVSVVKQDTHDSIDSVETAKVLETGLIHDQKADPNKKIEKSISMDFLLSKSDDCVADDLSIETRQGGSEDDSGRMRLKLPNKKQEDYSEYENKQVCRSIDDLESEDNVDIVHVSIEHQSRTSDSLNSSNITTQKTAFSAVLSAAKSCEEVIEFSSEEEEINLAQRDTTRQTPAISIRDKHSVRSVTSRREGLESGSDDSLHERLVEKIKAESLARSSPGKEGPFKCPTCKRVYRTRESYDFHVRDCDFEVSTSDEDDKPSMKDLCSDRRSSEGGEHSKPGVSSDVEKLKSLSSSSPSPLNEPLTIIITDEYKDEKFSPSSRDLSDDCSSVQSQDSRRSSLRRSTMTQRNAAPAHLAKTRSKESKLSMSPDGSSCSSLLSPKSCTSRIEDKPSPKETMLEAVGLISRRSLELSPNSDIDGTALNKPLRLQPRVSPTAMTPKREKRSPAHAGAGGNMRPSIMAGGLPKPGSSTVKSIAITYDPVIIDDVKLESLKPKRPRQKRIWWVEASECPEGTVKEHEEAMIEREEEEEEDSDEEESVARRTRHRMSSELKSPELKSPPLRRGSHTAAQSTLDKSDEAGLTKLTDSKVHPTDVVSSAQKSGALITCTAEEPSNRNASQFSPHSECGLPKSDAKPKKLGQISPASGLSKLRSSPRLSFSPGDSKDKADSKCPDAVMKSETDLSQESTAKTIKKQTNNKTTGGFRSLSQIVDIGQCPLGGDPPENIDSPQGNVRITRSRERRGNDSKNEDMVENPQVTEDPLISIRRSSRPASKTAKLSKYLIQLKKDKETVGNVEMKSQKEAQTENTSSDTSLKRGQGRLRTLPGKDALEKCGPGRLRLRTKSESGTKQEARVERTEDGKSEQFVCEKLERPLSELEEDRNCCQQDGQRNDSVGSNDVDIAILPGSGPEAKLCPDEVMAERDTKGKDEMSQMNLNSVDVENDHSMSKDYERDHRLDTNCELLKHGSTEALIKETDSCINHKESYDNVLNLEPSPAEGRVENCDPGSEINHTFGTTKKLAKMDTSENETKTEVPTTSASLEELGKRVDSPKTVDSLPPESCSKSAMDKVKPAGQKLRIIIRSPNVAAAQTIGELIKKTALTVSPNTLDVTVTTKDTSVLQAGESTAEKAGSWENTCSALTYRQAESCESAQKDEASHLSADARESAEDTRSKDDTSVVSRSVSPDSLSAAYDIQSDDFSSETSNDMDDFPPCIPNNSESTSQVASAPLAATASSQLSSNTQPVDLNSQIDEDDDDDVVIVKAIGLQPPEPNLAFNISQAVVSHSQSKATLSSSHSQQYSTTPAMRTNTPSTVSITSGGRILSTPSVMQHGGALQHLSHQQPLTVSPTRQNIHPFISLHPRTSPQQNQSTVMISEVSPGRFILQQQANARPEFLPSHDMSRSGFMLQNSGQTGIIIQTQNQTGIALQNPTQPGIIFRHASAGMMLPPGNPTAILPGQAPILQNTGQSSLPFYSLNPGNPLAPSIISPLQHLQPHVNSPTVLSSNMGIAQLMQASTLGNQSLMMSQPFLAHQGPGMFLPQVSTQPMVPQHSEQMDMSHRQQQQLQSPLSQNSQQQHITSSAKPSSVIIDPHAHMLSSGLNQTVLKASMQQYSSLKQKAAGVTSGFDQETLPTQLMAQPSTASQLYSTTHATFSPASTVFASPTLKSYPTVSTLAPSLSLPQATKLSVPKLTKVDGAPAQVSYMGSFDLNSASLQSVVNSSQNFNQDASKRIVELVQSALKNQGKEQIPGVEVTTAITNTPEGPKKVLRVFINEDILPSKSFSGAAAPGLGGAPVLSTSSAAASLMSLAQASSAVAAQTDTDAEWTKLLPSSSQVHSSPQPQQSPNLWTSSNSGFVSIPISQSLSATSRSSQSTGPSRSLSSAQFRRALKPGVYSQQSKRKLAQMAAVNEGPQAKKPVFEKLLKSDGVFSGTMQQIVERHAYISDSMSCPTSSTNPASGHMSSGQTLEHGYDRDAMLSSHSAMSSSSFTDSTRDDHPAADFSTSGDHTHPSASSSGPTCESAQQGSQLHHLQQHPYHHITQQQLQQSPHKRASFPLVSPVRKPQIPVALSPSSRALVRKQLLHKSVVSKDKLQTGDKEVRRLSENKKSGVRPRRHKTALVASHHPLIHHKKGVDSLPQPTLEEEVVATPLDLGRGEHPHGPGARSDRERSQSRLKFEITSDDGFSCQGDTVEDAWNQVLERVQDVRAASRMKQLSYAGISGRTMFGLDHNAVVYLIEQLYGALHCHHNYKFRFHKYDLDQADEEVALNPSGAARSESFASRKPFDMFNFLKSVYRTKPGDDEREKEEEMALKSSRRATSLSLPMAMRFRKLKTFAKEAVDVYRSKIHGRGLFCKRNIDAGEMVIEYAGEVIRASLTDKREKYYESKGIGCYMFRIDDDEVVDATMHGSAARFINHSCEPNCFSKVILVDGKKHIVIFAMRPIKRGEELTYDYKFPIEEVKIPCSCGSKRCRKYLN